MADTKWGFEKEYGHRVLPHKWSQSSAYRYYCEDPLSKKSHRRADIPAYRDDLKPLTTSYTERSQDSVKCNSAYGCHKDFAWDDSLRSSRNPFPGRKGRETEFVRSPAPSPPTSCTGSRNSSLASSRRSSLQSTTRALSTSRQKASSLSNSDQGGKVMTELGQDSPKRMVKTAKYLPPIQRAAYYMPADS